MRFMWHRKLHTWTTILIVQYELDFRLKLSTNKCGRSISINICGRQISSSVLNVAGNNNFVTFCLFSRCTKIISETRNNFPVDDPIFNSSKRQRNVGRGSYASFVWRSYRCCRHRCLRFPTFLSCVGTSGRHWRRCAPRRASSAMLDHRIRARLSLLNGILALLPSQTHHH